MENLVCRQLGAKKHKGLIWSVIISIGSLSSCSSSDVSTDFSKEIHGKTQGTTYSIILAGEGNEITKNQIDSIFLAFDMALSTYVSESAISLINNSKDSITIADNQDLFKDCYQLSAHIYSITNGAFDPSVFPLVKGWGFMNKMDSPLTKSEVDSILQFVSFENNKLHSVSFKGDSVQVVKSDSNFKIDFNAVAQGQSVDLIASYLDGKGYSNYFVEIGGELKVKGKNREGGAWRIGIDAPKENLSSRELENILSLSNKAVATSGNYRKFYIKDGKKYAHTLNPRTGFPVQHSLLSVTVVAEDCATADAFATAFMVIGKEATLNFVKNNPQENLEVYLLSAGKDGAIIRDMSSDFEKFLTE